MSWKASSFVKDLLTHADGTKLNARQKLVLFVLADYHTEERDCAWAGLTSIAKKSLTSRRHLLTIIGELERRGTLIVQRREKDSNLYRFAGMQGREVASPPREITAPGVGKQLVPQGREVATAPKPPLNPQKEEPPFSLGADAPPKPKRATSFPDSFILTDQRRAYAVKIGIPDPASEFEAFKDYCLANGSVYKDWDAAWRTRCNNYHRFNGQRMGTRPIAKPDLQTQLDDLMVKHNLGKPWNQGVKNAPGPRRT